MMSFIESPHLYLFVNSGEYRFDIIETLREVLDKYITHPEFTKEITEEDGKIRDPIAEIKLFKKDPKQIWKEETLVIEWMYWDCYANEGESLDLEPEYNNILLNRRSYYRVDNI